MEEGLLLKKICDTLQIPIAGWTHINFWQRPTDDSWCSSRFDEIRILASQVAAE